AQSRTRCSICDAPSGGPSFTGNDAVRWNQRAPNSPARLPCPLLTRSLAVGPSSQPMTSTQRSCSQPSSGGTRTSDAPPSPAAASASYSAASGAGSSAYALTATRRPPARASKVAREPGVYPRNKNSTGPSPSPGTRIAPAWPAARITASAGIAGSSGRSLVASTPPGQAFLRTQSVEDLISPLAMIGSEKEATRRLVMSTIDRVRSGRSRGSGCVSLDELMGYLSDYVEQRKI